MKVSKEQWLEIFNRIDAWEKQSTLAKEFDLWPNYISLRYNSYKNWKEYLRYQNKYKEVMQENIPLDELKSNSFIFPLVEFTLFILWAIVVAFVTKDALWVLIYFVIMFYFKLIWIHFEKKKSKEKEIWKEEIK